jgi:putative tryptophan/tyrosine transport system substrate-binding protein
VRRREFIAGLGGVAAWPLAVRAQQSRLRVIGVLADGSRNGVAGSLDLAFRRGLADQGYVVGQNIDILNRYAETHYDRLPQLAADLISHGVSIVLARGTPLVARAAMAASATLPIVFVTGVDPVEAGLVVSLNRPSGNATGVTVFMNDLMGKRLQLLHEIVPGATSIGLLDNPSYPEGKIIVAALETGARTLGVRLVIANASTPSEIERAFAELVRQEIGGLLALPEIFFDEEHDQIATLAAAYRIPVMYYSREEVEAGGLMSYGPSRADAQRLAATYVARVINGARPADLPVQRSTRIETIINLKVAKTLGLTVPNAILLLADEVIE